MKEETNSKQKSQTWVLVTAAIGFIVVVVLVISVLSRPSRSVEAYCEVYKQENARLSSAKGTTYSVKVFAHSSSDPHDFVVAFANLEKVAPKEIQPDVSGLHSVFATIEKNPSQALSASFSGLSAETNVTTWTQSHCMK